MLSKVGAGRLDPVVLAQAVAETERCVVCSPAEEVRERGEQGSDLVRVHELEDAEAANHFRRPVEHPFHCCAGLDKATLAIDQADDVLRLVEDGSKAVLAPLEL